MADTFERKSSLGNLSVSDEGVITGIAWPFGSPDRIGDTIEPKAFSGIEAPIPMLAHHNPEQPVGVWDSIEITTKGLEVTGRLLVTDVAAAREMHALVKAGGITGLSIGFQTLEAKGKRGIARTISRLKLHEISLVTIPSHPGARVRTVKSAAKAFAIAALLSDAAQNLKLT